MRLETHAWPASYGAEAKPRMGFFTDTSVCIGCKACEVACKEWNQIPMKVNGFSGKSYDNSLELDADRWLFGGWTPSVWLQHHLWHGHVRWYDVVFWCVYLTHFFATPVLAAILWKLDRPRFRAFAVLVATLSFMGLATYALFPAAPPWMAAQAGLTAPITRIIPHVMSAVGTKSAGSLIEHGYAYANNVAAVPSLHTAFALLIALTLWPVVPRWLRPVVALYPLAMGFTLVYTGEHYVFDVLLGWVYTVVAVLAGRALIRWWLARRAARDRAAEGVYAGAQARL